MLAAAVILAGCAAHFTPEAVSEPYGLFSGIWHGLIFPFALLANLLSWALSLIGVSFLQAIEIIGRPNTGLWYYVGFALGLCFWGGAGSS
ncbi:hypothetical protein WKW79_14545 [Variovorax robiniae]|uniref:Uncharacterized protein n=1 Tax=Variovorax robiniae TaxID=1836199 RepID=A0ABU8X9J8_9BURK